MAAIEVEKKFVIDEDTESKLKTLGANLVCEKSFSDIYYDTEQHELIFADHWFRKRNSSWELKYNPMEKQRSSRNTQYIETTSIDQIIEIILPLIKLTSVPKTINTIEQLLQVAKFKPVVSFHTKRKTYRIDNCDVDLDCADFGYHVGEIEKVVDSEEKVVDALQDIDTLASKLGITSTERVPGKFSMYLKMNNPELLQRLLQQ